MTRAEVKVGGVYLARVSGKLVPVRIDSIGLGGLGRRQVTTYVVTNLSTGRKMFRSAQKFRGEWKGVQS